ncbi:MAG TPA: indole-3-glycerol-phosphate synthase TrpC, partial [Phycisphaerales bacterium]|nr:indole-3-glycerol-phosphate synthase TrpC [Phycisphaerales bacterium]
MNVLKEIIEYKKQVVAADKSAIPLEQLKEQIKDLPKCRNFYTAVTKQNVRGINVIAEVKKASPSAGLIRENF